jgi:hypothetical protein
VQGNACPIRTGGADQAALALSACRGDMASFPRQGPRTSLTELVAGAQSLEIPARAQVVSGEIGFSHTWSGRLNGWLSVSMGTGVTIPAGIKQEGWNR